MYRKVLVPVDESVEADDVRALVQDDVASDAEIVLLQVIPPPKTHAEGDHVILGKPAGGLRPPQGDVLPQDIY